jgi:hypothetical protein
MFIIHTDDTRTQKEKGGNVFVGGVITFVCITKYVLTWIYQQPKLTW